MNSVFLSYDHDDAAKARWIANALEKAGHSVWWDGHIKGGSQFSTEIERALNAAEVVVVLWSERSVESAWVRDEAAAGRDRGQLVPIKLDRAEPPLGFRQYQTIDLSGWSGRGKPRQMQTVLEAVDSLRDKEPGLVPATSVTTPARADHEASGLRLNPQLIAVIVGLLIMSLGLLISRPWELKAPVPVVAVVPADHSATANALARDLLVKLGSLRAAKTDGVQMVGPGRGRVDFIFEVSGSVRASGANLALLVGKDRSVLWSSNFEQQAGSAADLRHQTAFTAARVLGCALEGLSPENERLSQTALKLYLNACALLGDIFWHDTSEVIPILEKVIEQTPRFEPAWAKLLVAETNRYQTMTAEEQKESAGNLSRRIAGARQVNSDMPEAYIAEIELLPGVAFYDQVGLIDSAAKAGPDNAFVLAGRSLILLGVGRLDAAVKDGRRAASLDPLSPAMRSSYLQALIYSGRTHAARSELAKAERLWPKATTILDARYRLSLAYGSVEEAADALRLIQSGTVRGGRTREAFVQARLNATPANIDRAVERATSAYRARPEIDTISDLVLTLGEFDRTEDLLSFLLAFDEASHVPYFVEILFRPPLADIRADRRFMRVTARFGLLDYWQRSGDWPDFCSEPDLPYDCKAEAAKLAA